MRGYIMAKEFARKFYQSKAWARTRLLYIDSVNGLCERCGSLGYILHHLIKLTPTNITDPAIAYGFNNLQYCCLDCHNFIHFNKNNAVVEGIAFDINGNIVYI